MPAASSLRGLGTSARATCRRFTIHPQPKRIAEALWPVGAAACARPAVVVWRSPTGRAATRCGSKTPIALWMHRNEPVGREALSGEAVERLARSPLGFEGFLKVLRLPRSRFFHWVLSAWAAGFGEYGVGRPPAPQAIVRQLWLDPAIQRRKFGAWVREIMQGLGCERSRADGTSAG